MKDCLEYRITFAPGFLHVSSSIGDRAVASKQGFHVGERLFTDKGPLLELLFVVCYDASAANISLASLFAF